MTLTVLQATLNYQFNDLVLLKTALRHKSAGKPNNERLEFLGDAILDAIIAEALYKNKDETSEGKMTTVRAQLVRGNSLAEIAMVAGIDQNLELGLGERKAGVAIKHSILEDALEAVIGAAFLDSDYARCKRMVLTLFEDAFSNASLMPSTKDAKTILQELMQANKLKLPVYQLTATDGPAHERSFTVECSVELNATVAVGVGNNRRAAEQQAAQSILQELEVVTEERND